MSSLQKGIDSAGGGVDLITKNYFAASLIKQSEIYEALKKNYSLLIDGNKSINHNTILI